jgi:uncharacterized membrane protein HdeD (DUF308 family)
MLFVYLHIIWFAAWIILGVEHYPYGLLTMIVSLEAIFLSTFVMISQNRADEKRQVLADHQWQTVQEEDQQNEEAAALVQPDPGAHQGHPRTRHRPVVPPARPTRRSPSRSAAAQADDRSPAPPKRVSHHGTEPHRPERAMTGGQATPCWALIRRPAGHSLAGDADRNRTKGRTKMLSGERMIVRQWARYWWVFLVSGILWLLIAWVVLRGNQTSIAAVGVLIGVVFLLAGINEVGMAAVVPGGWKVWHYILAVLFILAGLWGFIRPVNTFFALASVLGLILIFYGAFEIIQAIASRAVNPYWWLGLILGILLVLLAFWVSGSTGCTPGPADLSDLVLGGLLRVVPGLLPDLHGLHGPSRRNRGRGRRRCGPTLNHPVRVKTAHPRIHDAPKHQLGRRPNERAPTTSPGATTRTSLRLPLADQP